MPPLHVGEKLLAAHNLCSAPHMPEAGFEGKLSTKPALQRQGRSAKGALVDQGEAPEEAASRWREGVLEDAGASSSFAGVFNLGARSRYVSAPPVATVRQIWSPAAAQVIHQSVMASVCHLLYLLLLLNVTLKSSLLLSNFCFSQRSVLHAFIQTGCPSVTSVQNWQQVPASELLSQCDAWSCASSPARAALYAWFLQACQCTHQWLSELSCDAAPERKVICLLHLLGCLVFCGFRVHVC